jgi:mycofactocin precursor
MAQETLQQQPAALESTTDEVDEDELIQDELLVEEISIDGMCGVY